MRFYTLKQVCQMFGVARVTIGRWEEMCGFPRRARFGTPVDASPAAKHINRRHCHVRFSADLVDAWAKSRM